jgi:hypothetical protein
VIMTMEQWAEMTGEPVEEVVAPPPTPAKRNRIVPERDNTSGEDRGGGGSRTSSQSTMPARFSSAESDKPKPMIPLTPHRSPGGNPTTTTNALRTSGNLALSQRELAEELDNPQLEVYSEADINAADADVDSDLPPWESEPDAVTDEWTGSVKLHAKAHEIDDEDVNTTEENEWDDDSDDCDTTTEIEDESYVSGHDTIQDNDSEATNEIDENTVDDAVSDSELEQYDSSAQPRLMSNTDDFEETWNDSDSEWEEEAENDEEKEND